MSNETPYERDEQVFAKDLLEEIPRKTGVYVFEGPAKANSDEPQIIYVGKAKNLNSRVRQYFNETDKRPFVEFIRKRVERVRTIVLSTEQEALILENELIKRHRPPYNLHLKDDKRYLSLRLDLSHEWPKFEVVRKIKKDKAIYLGPFSSAKKLRTTLDIMQKVFPLRTCSDHKLYNRSRPCIEYEIKRCVAPCVNYVTPEAYRKLLDEAVLFLRGKDEDLLAGFKSTMENLAEAENFEEAAKMRDRIQAIELILMGGGLLGHPTQEKGLDADAIGCALSDDAKVGVIVLVFVRGGVVFDQRIFEFKNVKLNREDFLKEFLERYYGSEVYVPAEIYLAEEIRFESDDWTSYADKIVSPRSEEKKKFVRLAEENARVRLEGKIQKTDRLEKTLKSLQMALGLQQFPETMDCLDISHHQGMETVASVVRFRDGSPEKDFYRRIKMKENQVNDFDSMREAVERRYHAVEDLPKLLVIDGGPGQLSAAVKVLEERDFFGKTEIVSLAKKRDREGLDPLNPQNRERIFLPRQKNPILLKENSNEELLLRFLRDEAHRFAITYHRLRKTKTMSISILDEVPGISMRLKKRLLQKFGSVSAIAEASDYDLLKEIPEKTLLSLRLTLNQASGE